METFKVIIRQSIESNWSSQDHNLAVEQRNPLTVNFEIQKKNKIRQPISDQQVPIQQTFQLNWINKPTRHSKVIIHNCLTTLDN